MKHTRNTLINYMKMCATTLVHEKQQVKVELAEAIFDLLTENGKVWSRVILVKVVRARIVEWVE